MAGPRDAGSSPAIRRQVDGRLIVVFGLVGLGLLVSLITRLGPRRIASQLHGLTTILPWVLALTSLKYPLQTAGWRLAIPRADRPSWWESIRSTIAGDAIGYLTWAGPLMGEPARALLTRRTVPFAEGIAAGAGERTLYNLTATGLVWIVLARLLWVAHPTGVALSVAGSVALIGWLIAWLRSAMRRSGGQLHRNRVPLTSGLASDANADEAHDSLVVALVDLWRTRRHVLPALFVLCLAQHAVLVAEAYFLLRSLSADTTLQTALVFEAVTKIVNTAGMVVPARLGVAEGGSALLADALGFAASHGLSLALMRRVRALVWAAVGLAALPFQEARARRASPVAAPTAVNR